MASGRVFETSKKKGSACVYVNEYNHIQYINTLVNGFDKTRYPCSQDYFSFMDEVFKMMMSSEIETFKALLRKIKFSEPECYEKGVKMLEDKRNSHLKKAEKYVL